MCASSTTGGPELIERLREAWLPFKTGDGHSAQINVLLNEAANRIEKLEAALIQAKPVVEYVSMGRGYIGVDIYPDATARRVNAQIQEALDA